VNSGILFWVRLVGFLEGLSAFALFLVAMPMKYVFDSISKENFFSVGLFHGLLWTLYAIVATTALIQRRLSLKQYFLLAFFSLLPLGPIIADRFVMKAGVGRD
jgi:integral membrane protein